MKPTSMIFLVLSLILIFGGFMTCNVAKSMAASQGIPIYDTTFDSNGDAVYTYDISDTALNKLILNFSGVDVNIIGNAERSYIELKNFDVNSYRVTLSGGNVTVDGTVGFLSSLLDMSAGGIQFKGLRYFLLDKPDPERPKSVTVYLTSLSELKTLSVSLEKGTVAFENIQNSLDYSVSLNNADATFRNVISTSIASISASSGNIKMVGSRFVTINATIENGNATIIGNDILSYQRTSYQLSVKEAGNIVYNGGNAGTAYKATSPAPEATVFIDVDKGIISIDDGGFPAIAPASTQPSGVD